MAVPCIYYLRDGKAYRRTHSSIGTVEAYAAWARAEARSRKLLVGEMVPDSIGQVNDAAQFHGEVCRLLDAGRHITDRTQVIRWFNEWCSASAKLPPYIDNQRGDCTPSVPTPAGPEGKPRTVIVQDFIRDTGAGEVARRAWAATVAACKGI